MKIATLEGMLRGWLPVLIFFGISEFAPTNAIETDTLISPDDPKINYYGRFDFSNPKAPRFNWSGSTIELLVSGTTTLGMELTDGAGYYDIEIDGTVQAPPVFADSWDSKKYALAAELSPQPHIIRIIRRNEPYWAIATLSGIYLSRGGEIMPLAKPVRKMEFCGDSWTAGYFVEACADQQLNTNANRSWARLTSKAFNAQDIILAESGIGLAKSLGGKTCFPKKYLGTFDTIGGASTPMWNFSTWIPDIVTIFLGINDKSSGATDDEYGTAVHSFVTTIRGNYPDVPILFIAESWMMDEATKTAVAAETTSLGHNDIHFLECKTRVSGCSAHPNLAENGEIADSVVAKIKEITGWDAPVANAITGRSERPALPISIVPVDSRTIIIYTHPTAVGYPIQVFDIHGRIVQQLQGDRSGTYRWNSSRLTGGMYLVGGMQTGWKRVLVNR